MENNVQIKGMANMGSLGLSEALECICKDNDLNRSYFIIREAIPVSWRQVKLCWLKIRRRMK